jgi:hypothetical protein
MPLTDKLTDVGVFLATLLTENIGALGIKAVFYGDQVKLPSTPVVCVEPDGKSRILSSTTRRTDIELRVFVIVYHSAVKSPQSNRYDSDLLAESIEELIHTKRTMGGLVIHSMVTAIESGYSTKETSLVRASRLTVEARSKTQLPMEEV